jgi:O-antigen ligase
MNRERRKNSDSLHARRIGLPPALLAAVVLGAAFFVIEHDLQKSTQPSYALSAEEIEDSVETGSMPRQLAFLSVGGLGLCLACRRGGRRLSLADPLVIAALLFVAWSAASIAWSADKALTAKRVVVLGSCFLAALGLARQASARDLLRMATVILLAYVAVGIGVEIALGTFQPWDGEYRFAGTVHPNAQGLYCAALVLAAVTGWLGRRRRTDAPSVLRLPPSALRLPPSLWLLVLAAAGGLLLLTRSRAACLGLLAALAAVALVRMHARARTLVMLGAAWLAAAVLLVWASWGVAADPRIVDVLLLGRTEDAAELSGRLPLWTDLLDYVGQHPLGGYGYDSFWTPQHIDEISASSQWMIHVAHSAYLETLLSVGLIGAAALAVAVALGLGRLAVRWRASGEAGYGFLFGLVVLAAVNGLLESGFVQPMFLTLVAACGIGLVVARPVGAGRTVPVSPAMPARSPETRPSPRGENLETTAE